MLLILSKSLSDITDDILNNNFHDQDNAYLYNELLDSIIYKVIKLANSFNVNIMYLFKLVHQSNMSKICISLTEAINTVEWYKLNEKKYTHPIYTEIVYNEKKYYVISDGATGKVLN